MKTIAEVTYSDLAAGHIVLDPDGGEWTVEDVRSGMPDGVVTFAALVRNGKQSTWIQGAFSEPIAIVDQTIADSVETVGRILQGHVILEPLATSGKAARAMLIAHLRHHHMAGVTGAKPDGTLKELIAYHASLHTPVSTSGIPHIHKEVRR